jgi:alpha-tubulin suppressor-like RCC1 family protein
MGASDIKGGDGHLCVSKGTEIWCWGASYDGQLNAGSNNTVAEPIKVADSGAVGLGNYHTCWVNADTTISCVGANYHGTMGNGSGNDFAGADQTTPGPVITEAGTPFMGAVEVAAGGAMTCARTTDGHVWCWGDNKYGQVGAGSPTPYPALVVDAVTGKPLEHADRLIAKYAHACAHTSDEGWKCWGRGSQGELADGKQRSRGAATPLGVTCP